MGASLSKENALQSLKKYDTVLVVDDSLSMKYENRWKEVSHCHHHCTAQYLIAYIYADCAGPKCTGRARKRSSQI